MNGKRAKAIRKVMAEESGTKKDYRAHKRLAARGYKGATSTSSTPPVASPLTAKPSIFRKRQPQYSAPISLTPIRDAEQGITRLKGESFSFSAQARRQYSSLSRPVLARILASVVAFHSIGA